MTETIKLQFVRERDFLARIIAWFYNFSHVDTVLDDGQLLGARGDRAGGKPPGVQIRPPGYADFASSMVMVVPVRAEQKATYLAFLHEQIGKPYDSKMFWAFLFNRDRDWREMNNWFCSELVAAGAEQAQIIPQLCIEVNKITPGGLALIMSAIGGAIVSPEAIPSTT